MPLSVNVLEELLLSKVPAPDTVDDRVWAALEAYSKVAPAAMLSAELLGRDPLPAMLSRPWPTVVLPV